MRNVSRYALFAAIVLIAVGLVAWRYYDYLVNPWTRDGSSDGQCHSDRATGIGAGD